MNILVFILGVFCGVFGIGIVMAGSMQNELEDAYAKGRADERATLIEKLENKYGGNDNG